MLGEEVKRAEDDYGALVGQRGGEHLGTAVHSEEHKAAQLPPSSQCNTHAPCPRFSCSPAARVQRHSQAVRKERAAVADDMARLAVESAAVGRAVKAAAREREERLVERDLKKLEVRRLRMMLGR